MLLEQLTDPRAEQAMADCTGLPIERYGHHLLLPRIWELRENVTPHDAAHVALAEALGAPLLTCDARLTRTPGHRAAIPLV